MSSVRWIAWAITGRGGARDRGGAGKEVGHWSWKANHSDLGISGFLKGSMCCCWEEMQIVFNFHLYLLSLKKEKKRKTIDITAISYMHFVQWLLVMSPAKAFLRHCENRRLWGSALLLRPVSQLYGFLIQTTPNKLSQKWASVGPFSDANQALPIELLDLGR